MTPLDPSKEEAKKKIERDLNGGAGLKHNHGQPKRAPHAPQGTRTTAKFLTNCVKEHSDSLQCIERNYQNRAACDPFFQAYKQCRKEENDQRKNANAAKSGNTGWFW